MPISLCWQVGEVQGPAASLASWVILDPVQSVLPSSPPAGSGLSAFGFGPCADCAQGSGSGPFLRQLRGGPGDLPGQVASAQCQGGWSFQEEKQGWRRRLGQVVQALVCPWVCYVET